MGPIAPRIATAELQLREGWFNSAARFRAVAYSKGTWGVRVFAFPRNCERVCGDCVGRKRKWILSAGPARKIWVARSSKNADAEVGAVTISGSERIERRGAGPLEAGEGSYEDGWGSGTQDWEGAESGANQSKGLFVFMSGTILVVGAAMFAGARVLRFLQSQEQLQVFGWTLPTATTLREQEHRVSPSQVTRQPSQGTSQVTNSRLKADNAATKESVVGSASGDYGQGAEESYNSNGGLGMAANTVESGESWGSIDDWSNVDEGPAGYVDGSAGAVGEDVLPVDSAPLAAETPLEGSDEEAGTANASPQAEDPQALSSEEVTALASHYSMDSLRERAQLAARAATAASDAAQRAAAYSAAASSASSAAVAAAERAAAAAGSAQIAVESCAEEAILEAQDRALKAAETAARAEDRAANAAAMAAGYEDSAEAQAAFASEAADLRPYGEESLMEKWQQWWFAVWTRVVGFSRHVAVVIMAWMSQLLRFIRHLVISAAGAIQRASSNWPRPFGKG